MAKVLLAEAHVIQNAGLDGCAHARPNGKRQVLLVDVEKIRQKRRVGEAELEASARWEPCELMEEIRAALMQELVGRRGMLCRVVRGGAVKWGDRVVMVSALSSDSVSAGGWAHRADDLYPVASVFQPALRAAQSIGSRRFRQFYLQ